VVLSGKVGLHRELLNAVKRSILKFSKVNGWLEKMEMDVIMMMVKLIQGYCNVR
jgi:hypothetical protein